MVMGTTIVLAVLIVVMILISDILYKVVDPRPDSFPEGTGICAGGKNRRREGKMDHHETPFPELHWYYRCLHSAADSKRHLHRELFVLLRTGC